MSGRIKYIRGGKLYTLLFDKGFNPFFKISFTLYFGVIWYKKS